MKIYFNQVSDSILHVKIDKRTECFNFGADNAFPSLIEVLIEMSVTAKTCTDRVSKSIYGKGFGEAGQVIVNSKGQSLNEILRLTARQYSKHNNSYLQISYDANLEINAIVVVPVTDVRIGKADDKGYSGKFIVYDNWDKTKARRIEPSKFELYDRYNSDKIIIEGQIRKSAGENKDEKIEDIISDYNGQILHTRKDESYKYSLTDLQPVIAEAFLESNSQTFRSRGASKGFLNTKVIVTKPFKDDPTRKKFMDYIKSFEGADESSSTLVIEASENTDDLEKEIKIEDFTGEFNDKLFEYSDKQAEKNICKAFSVPTMLVTQTDNSLFGQSGELLQEGKTQLWESREEDRLQLEEVFSSLMNKFQQDKRIEGDLTITNPYIDTDEIKDAKNINRKAQANLRGSVGGVTALTSLIESINAGSISKESAVAVIKGVYGYTESKAKEMVGWTEDDDKVEETT